MSSTNQYISPTEIGEYLSFDHCNRYFTHRTNDISRTENHTEDEFAEAFNPLNILLSRTGEEFEQRIFNNLDQHTIETIDLTTEDESDGISGLSADEDGLISTLSKAQDRKKTDKPYILYQPTLTGSIQQWSVGGHADFILIWPDENDTAELRVIDAKSTQEEQTYHQVQAATYIKLIEDIIAHSEIDESNITLTGGIISRNSDYLPPNKATIPSFDHEPKINDISRLLSEDNEIAQANTQPLQEAEHQINEKCAGCGYNEACVTSAFESRSVRLLGLSESEQELLESHGITTIDDLADLCTEPKEWEWNPTEQKRAGFTANEYRSLKSKPGFGEKLPDIVYRAQALKNRLSAKEEEYNTPWIPGKGNCNLPDDTPPEEFDFEYQRGSLIRVYLNIQQDHLRDRLIQLNARITATAGDHEPIRISTLADNASEDPQKAEKAERDLLSEFIQKLYQGIQTISDSINLDLEIQKDPLLHFYSYTEQEVTALVETLTEYNDTEEIASLQDLIEGQPGEDKKRVSFLKPEIESKIAIPSPSYGIMHAYDELQPPNEEYSKSRHTSAWSYTPSYIQNDESINLRQVFNRRLFNISVDWELNQNQITVKPGEYSQSNDLKTRFRYGAKIPLGYHWSAIGKIDEAWKDSIDTADGNGLIEFEINSYLYHDASKKQRKVRKEDVVTLGKNICDIVEHIERSLIYKDSTITERKTPVDTSDLYTDTHETPTIGEAAREYLWLEHTTQQHEKYEHYQKLPVQRMLTGKSIPIQITDIDEDAGNSLCITIEGKIRYDEYFGDRSDAVKRVCKQKGGEGTSSGSWMVANPLDPGRTDNVLSEPYELEKGVNATIQHINWQEETLTVELRNEYWDPGKFDTYHRNYTTDRGRAESDDYTYISGGEWLLLDPLTDNLAADRANKALQNLQTNELHKILNELRFGGDDAILEESFNELRLTEFNRTISKIIPPETYPNEKQSDFIEEPNQLAVLQGPPGTGKTAGTLAPSLLGRIYAAEREDESVAGLVTAPSNTAIDEMLEDTTELLSQLQAEGVDAVSPEDLQIIRLTRDDPDNPCDHTTYADYNSDGDLATLRTALNTIQGTTEHLSGSKSGSSSGPDDNQQTFAEYVESIEPEDQESTSDKDDDSAPDYKHVLIFATPTKSWGLLKHYSNDDAEPEDIAQKSFWDLLAIDEASMLTIPNFLLSGVAMKRDAQVLISGDQRQLPPVQTHEWGGEVRRSIKQSAPYLSALEYCQLLSGKNDVLPEDHREEFISDITPNKNEIPITQLNTTYRFGPDTAEFIRSAVYEEDGIKYRSDRPTQNISPRHTANSDSIKSAFSDSEVTLITYNAPTNYQQVNTVEMTISQAILRNHHPDATAGLVTPHNAQRSRLKQMLKKLDRALENDPNTANPINIDETTLVETVERFQGGQRDLMLVNATVSDPQFIQSENEFLLEQTRANVSFTRHKEKLIVVASESLLSHIPSDPEIYNDALLWKELPSVVGEPPTYPDTPAWSGNLAEFVSPLNPPSYLDNDKIDIAIHHL